MSPTNIHINNYRPGEKITEDEEQKIKEDIDKIVAPKINNISKTRYKNG